MIINEPRTIRISPPDALASSRALMDVFGLLWEYVDNEERLELLVAKMAQGLQNSTKDPKVPKLYIRETLEAFRQGSHGGVAYDASLFTQPWGFELEGGRHT